jgi:hypothetical protein
VKKSSLFGTLQACFQKLTIKTISATNAGYMLMDIKRKYRNDINTLSTGNRQRYIFIANTIVLGFHWQWVIWYITTFQRYFYGKYHVEHIETGGCGVVDGQW